MATNILIKLCYGPSESYGIIQHQTQRLYGLLQFLKQEKYFVEFEKTCHLNRLTVEMLEREIFRCDIRNLQFNMPWEGDVVCRRIIDAIRQHELMFTDPMNMPKFPHIGKGLRWLVFKDLLPLQEFFSKDVSVMHHIGAPTNSLQSFTIIKSDNQGEINKPTSTDSEMSFVDKQDDSEPQFVFYDIKLPSLNQDNEEADTLQLGISQESIPFDNRTECFGPCDTCPPLSTEAPPPSRESEGVEFRGASLETKRSFSTLSGDYSNKAEWKEKSFNREVHDELQNVVRISLEESIQTLVKYDNFPEPNVVNKSEEFYCTDLTELG